MSSLYLLFYFSLQITAFFKPRKVIHQHTLLRLNIISHNDITSDKEISYKRFIDTKNLFTSLASAVLLPKVVQAVGYQAAPSAFSPNQFLYSPPLLPQSALLNSLPFSDLLVAELQAYLESFVQLINPSEAQENQIMKNDSVLWNNLRINSQRAAGMLIYNKNELLTLPIISNDTNEILDELQTQRKYLSEQYISSMQQDVLRLVNGSRKSSVSESLRYMRRSLNGLCNVAYMLTPLNTTEISSISSHSPSLSVKNGDDDSESDRSGDKVQGNLLSSIADLQDFSNIPRLYGRATVVLTFQRPGSANILPSSMKRNAEDVAAESYKFKNQKQKWQKTPKTSVDGGVDRAYVTMVIDGINHPLTGGNFVDLCLRGFYDNLPVRFEAFEYGGDFVNRTVLGFDKGYLDDKTGKKRQLPLEVLRDARDKTAKTARTDKATAGTNQRFTAQGRANSPVFTKAAPVLSFATNGAIGMMHSIGDENGASGSFFWPQVDRTKSVFDRSTLPIINKMNNKFSLFAHVVEGNDVMDLLRPGDVLLSAELKEEDGAYILSRGDENDVIHFNEEED